MAGNWGSLRSGLLSLRLLGSGRPCGLEAQRWTLGSGVRIEAEPEAKGSCGQRGRWRERRAGPRGRAGRALPTGPVHPPLSFPGQRLPDEIKAQSPCSPAGSAGPHPTLAAPPRTTGGALGKGRVR